VKTQAIAAAALFQSQHEEHSARFQVTEKAVVAGTGV
jgi:hypothetical protein